MELSTVNKLQKNKNIKNVSLILFVGKSLEYVMVLNKNGTNLWMFPGGCVEPTDRTLFQAIKREFQEETGFIFPYFKNILPYYDYKGITRIFVGTTNRIFPYFDIKKTDGEAKELRYIHFDNLLSYPLRKSIRLSLLEMINNKFFELKTDIEVCKNNKELVKKKIENFLKL